MQIRGSRFEIAKSPQITRITVGRSFENRHEGYHVLEGLISPMIYGPAQARLRARGESKCTAADAKMHMKTSLVFIKVVFELKKIAVGTPHCTLIRIALNDC